MTSRESRAWGRGSPMRYGRFTIRDFHDYGDQLTVEDVLVKSSNIGAAHIGMAVGATRQRDFFDRAGLLEASPVELVEVTEEMALVVVSVSAAADVARLPDPEQREIVCDWGDAVLGQ